MNIGLQGANPYLTTNQTLITMKTLIEKLKQEPHYIAGKFKRTTKLQWMHRHYVEATLPLFTQLHKTLTTYTHELLDKDYEIKLCSKAILQIQSKRMYALTPAVQAARHGNKSGGFRNLLLHELRSKLQELIDSGGQVPLIKAALGQSLTIRERVLLQSQV